MAFNLNKYKDKVFHKDEGINKKIKALLLWYEFHSEQRELTTKGKLSLLDNMIRLCVKQEWFEIASFFRDKKSEIGK